VAAAILIVLVAAVSRAVLRRRRSRLAQVEVAQRLEAQARAMMSELCPYGWRAQVTLFGSLDELPPDAPAGDRARVALDWAELDAHDRNPAVVRRVWAPTIAEALDAMVDDRRTDVTLEQIEREARWGSP
jgi:hypothetical protein